MRSSDFSRWTISDDVLCGEEDVSSRAALKAARPQLLGDPSAYCEVGKEMTSGSIECLRMSGLAVLRPNIVVVRAQGALGEWPQRWMEHRHKLVQQDLYYRYEGSTMR